MGWIPKYELRYASRQGREATEHEHKIGKQQNISYGDKMLQTGKGGDQTQTQDRETTKHDETGRQQNTTYKHDKMGETTKHGT